MKLPWLSRVLENRFHHRRVFGVTQTVELLVLVFSMLSLVGGLLIVGNEAGYFTQAYEECEVVEVPGKMGVWCHNGSGGEWVGECESVEKCEEMRLGYQSEFD